MSASIQRDQAIALAKLNPAKALVKARSVSEPWFRAQALSSVARWTDGDPVPIAAEAAKAAAECDDAYKRSAVRAWEVAALAGRDCAAAAKKSLAGALKEAVTVQPCSSRSEALFILLEAAFTISRKEADRVNTMLVKWCPVSEHWRCKRAVRNAGKLINQVQQPRDFY